MSQQPWESPPSTHHPACPKPQPQTLNLSVSNLEQEGGHARFSQEIFAAHVKLAELCGAKKTAHWGPKGLCGQVGKLFVSVLARKQTLMPNSQRSNEYLKYLILVNWVLPVIYADGYMRAISFRLRTCLRSNYYSFSEV